MSKKKELSLEKIRENTIKKYFAQLHSRKCGFMYLNLFKQSNTYTFTNMETSDLIKYCEATLATHYLQVKSTNDNKILRELLLPLDIPSTIPFIVKINDYISLLNKVKYDLNEFPDVKISSDGIRYINIKDSKGKRKKQVLAYPEKNYHAIRLFQTTRSNIDIVMRNELEHEIAYGKDFELLDVATDDGKLLLPIDITQYTDNSGIQLFKYKTGDEKITLNLFDGLEVVSAKSFVKNIKGDFTYILKTWGISGYLEFIGYYMDSACEVFSTRPHNRVVIGLNKKAKTLKLKELTHGRPW